MKTKPTIKHPKHITIGGQKFKIGPNTVSHTKGEGDPIGAIENYVKYYAGVSSEEVNKNYKYCPYCGHEL